MNFWQFMSSKVTAPAPVKQEPEVLAPEVAAPAIVPDTPAQEPPVQPQPQECPRPEQPPIAKPIVLSPAIATFERLVQELQLLKDGKHPELLKLKREQEESRRQKFTVLENHAEYERQIIERQYRFEVQTAQDELDDFKASNGLT